MCMPRHRCGLGMLNGTCEISEGVLGRGQKMPDGDVLYACLLIVIPVVFRSTLSQI